MYITCDRNQNLEFIQMPSQEGDGGENILLILALVFFVEQPVVSFSLYNGAILWLMEAGWDGPVYITAPIWKGMSGIGDHRFIFLIHLLPNYTFTQIWQRFPLGDWSQKVGLAW